MKSTEERKQGALEGTFQNYLISPEEGSTAHLHMEEFV